MSGPGEGKQPTRVLLVEDDPNDAKLIQEALAGSVGRSYKVDWVMQLSAALARLGETSVEVVLLDLTLPDGQGIAAFDQIFAAAPRALILVLSGASDEELARQAVQRGAVDYFAKAHIDARWLPHALRYIMERKASQDALRDSEERFRAMSDASPLGIFVSDAQGDCVYTNAAYHKISGLDFEQALGTSWSKAIHPDDRQRIVVEWRDAVRGQEPFQTEVRFLREDGSVVWTRLNAAAMRDGLSSRGRVQTVEDITERKVADRELALAQEALFEEKERAQRDAGLDWRCGPEYRHCRQSQLSQSCGRVDDRLDSRGCAGAPPWRSDCGSSTGRTGNRSTIQSSAPSMKTGSSDWRRTAY